MDWYWPLGLLWFRRIEKYSIINTYNKSNQLKFSHTISDLPHPLTQHLIFEATNELGRHAVVIVVVCDKKQFKSKITSKKSSTTHCSQCNWRHESKNRDIVLQVWSGECWMDKNSRHQIFLWSNWLIRRRSIPLAKTHLQLATIRSVYSRNIKYCTYIIKIGNLTNSQWLDELQ